MLARAVPCGEALVTDIFACFLIQFSALAGSVAPVSPYAQKKKKNGLEGLEGRTWASNGEKKGGELLK